MIGEHPKTSEPQRSKAAYAFRDALILGPKSMVFGGLYAATRAKYRTVYGLHEHATLLAGQIELTEENSGKKRRV